MKVTARVALEIASHEALIRQTYFDSVGVATWSIGLTSATGHNVNRYWGKPQSLEHCLAVYVWALENYADAVRAEFKGHTLTEEQFAAALSFHWNTGAIKSALWPDLWKAGRIADARESFLGWRKPPEIEGRRKAEAALLFEGKWSAKGKIPEYARVTSRGTPDWGSRVLTDVTGVLERLLSVQPIPEPTPDPLEKALADLRDAQAELVATKTKAATLQAENEHLRDIIEDAASVLALGAKP